MTRRCILMLDSEGIRAWFWRAGWLAEGPQFPSGEEGYNAFAAWLGSQSGTHITLVADYVEEGFQFETIPYVTGRDRKALLSRKQGQLFYGSPYASAIPLGRERGGRRDERVLFVALTRPALLEPWVERLRRADTVIAGISTTALLIGGALRQQQFRAQAHLLTVCQTTAGIRQTLFEDGKLRFSRLAARSPNDPDWSESVFFEVQKTYQYLVAQRALVRGSQLAVAIFAAFEEHTALRTHCTDNDLLSFTLLDIAEQARQLGLRNQLSSSDASPLLAQLAVRNTGPTQLAPARDRQSYHWWLAQRITLYAGVCGLILALGLAAKTEMDTRTLLQTRDEIRLDTQANQFRYERLLASLPQLPAPVDSIQGVIGELDQLTKLGDGPTPDLVRISRVLNRHPEIELQRVDWTLPDQAPATVGSAPGSTQDVQREARSITLLYARLLSNSPLSQRETVDAVNMLLDDLRREGALEASVQRLPFEYGSDRTLRSANENNTSETRRIDVVLRISFPIGNRP
ncbi:MAG: hypothetical protein FWD62_05105 [Betaproteobacteria bacterium]|nr:hypothetical protein [Betaproteobacteria bacterium]